MNTARVSPSRAASCSARSAIADCPPRSAVCTASRAASIAPVRVAASRLRPRLGQRQLRSKQRRLQAVPRLRSAENLCRLELFALLAERLSEQCQRQRAPGITRPRQRIGGPAEQRHGGVEIALGDRHIAHQRLADRPAWLLQLGEVGVALGQRAGLGQPPGHQQRSDPAEAAGEPQQAGMVGGHRAPGQRLDVVEPADAGRAQRRRRSGPAHSHPVGVRRRQHLVRRSAARAAGCPRSSRRSRRARRGWPAPSAAEIRFRIVCRNAVARSGSLSIQNWLAARGSAHAISSGCDNWSGSTGGQHRAGFSSAALPGQRVGQRQPRGQSARPVQRGARELLGEHQLAEPERLLGRGHQVGGGAGGVAPEGQRVRAAAGRQNGRMVGPPAGRPAMCAAPARCPAPARRGRGRCRADGPRAPVSSIIGGDRAQRFRPRRRRPRRPAPLGRCGATVLPPPGSPAPCGPAAAEPDR